MNKSITTTRLRRFFLRSEIDRIMTLSVAFSAFMVVTRVIYTGSNTFLFLIWNLFLAFVPYVLSSWLQHQPFAGRKKWRTGILACIWLLFIPNSFYILTDLFHFGNYYSVPLWFDLVLIVSCAWNGLIFGLLSVRQMEKLLHPLFHGKRAITFIYPVMWLNALGVYVGRYLRFNSWDIITNPFALITDIGTLMIHPLRCRDAWGMIVCFSVFMTLMYLVIKKISKTMS